MSDIFDKVTNISGEDMTTVSLAKLLFIFYILIASNFTSSLLSKQMIEHIESSRSMQHIIGFFCVVILISTVTNIKDTKLVFLYSFMIYIWFILTTKLDLHLNIFILC